jgi:hypothetical protein
MSFLFEALAEILLKVILWVVLWPVVMLLCTPFLILRALFSKGPFLDNLSDGYDCVHRFWLKGAP